MKRQNKDKTKTFRDILKLYLNVNTKLEQKVYGNILELLNYPF